MIQAVIGWSKGILSQGSDWITVGIRPVIVLSSNQKEASGQS